MSEARFGGQLPAELVPDNAPFDEEQRAWLNGFFAGLLGLAGHSPRAPIEHRPAALVAAALSGAPAPWGNPALSIERRLQLSEGEDLEGRLSSALAQLECGQCGSSCQGYARALATGDEKDASLCAPGGPSTARHLELLLAEGGKSSPGVRGRGPGGAALRSVRGLAQPSVAPASPVPRPSLVAPRSLVRPGHDRPQSLHCRVKSQKKLTFADAGSEIREVVLELSGSEVQYRAGDCLAVFPHNDPDLVRSLLRAVGARGQEIVTTPNGSCEVWRCLLEDVDITHVRVETLQLFARAAGDAEERRALSGLAREGAPTSFDLLDLVAMFPSARPSIDQIVSTLGALEPRLYAIASSPAVHPGELHLAVRMVRAERAGRERKGVASHFLAEGVLRGDDLEVHVHPSDRFELPEDRKGPMIMLGSGTGVARFRAFLEELEVRGRRGNTWLIMASCFEGDEALYEAELRAWSRLGVLEHLDVVKLGQRGRRVGPQDVLRKRARRVISWLDRGAVVYACGEGKALSSVLNETLIEVLGRQGKMSQAQASDFVHVMRREGRYVEEVY
jgi:sulfite reductase (NADPH) flavoprotein alpha-component